MALNVSRAGHGLQLWQVRRLRVELFAQWPQDTPNEVWGAEVMDYDLPFSALNTVLDGSITIVADPSRPTLPAGIVQDTHLRGRPLRLTIGPGERLVQIVAVADDGTGWVIYRGLFGQAEQTDPRHWRIPLLDPAQLGLETFLDRQLDAQNGALPVHPVLAPPDTARIYGTYTVPDDAYASSMTRSDYWRKAMEAFPDASFGVGPDLVFAAGVGDTAPLAVYAVDHRVLGLKSEGRTIRDYLTTVRQSIEGLSDVDFPRSGPPLPPFLPPRLAVVGGQVVSEVRELSGNLNIVSPGGATSVKGRQRLTTTVAARLPPVDRGVRLQNMTMVVTVDVNSVTGRVLLMTEAFTTGVKGNLAVGRDTQEITLGGTWTFKIDPDAANLQEASGANVTVSVQGMTDDASATFSVQPGAASFRGEFDVISVTMEPLPSGLATPAVSDEAWTFRLPGIHAGLRVEGLPGGGVRSCTTRIRCTRDRPPYTEVHAGALPSRGAGAQA